MYCSLLKYPSFCEEFECPQRITPTTYPLKFQENVEFSNQSIISSALL